MIEPHPQPAKPFLKWAGGKTALLPQLLPLLPDDFRQRRYVEPFLGGGALFFHTRPSNALLSDINAKLIDVYSTLRVAPKALIRAVEALLSDHNKMRYVQRRTHFNNGASPHPFDQAARFLYLNRTCFNGLYRENKAGEFNVPIGSYKDPKIDAAVLLLAAEALKDVRLVAWPYEMTLAEVTREDFVYLDPPYDPVSESSDFKSYTKHDFGKEQQQELFERFDAIARGPEKHAKLMLSNADTPFVRQLYKRWNIQVVQAPRAINSKVDKRGAVRELVIRNYYK